jgi:hypothetical protein
MVVSAVVVGASAVAGAAISSKGAKDAAKTQATAADKAAAVGAENAQKAADTRVNAIKQSTDEQLGGLDRANTIKQQAVADAAAAQTEAIGKAADERINAANQAQQVYENALKTGNQTLIESTKAAADQKIAAAEQAMAAYNAGVEKANAAYWAATGRAHEYVNKSTEDANKGLKEMFESNRAMYTPYVDAGKEATVRMAEGLKGDGEFNHRFNETDMTKDGGYRFRLAEGLDALQNSALARGGLLSGNALKATTQYGQNFASNEYDKAYTRYNTDMNTRFTRLSDLANRGMTANGQVATLGTQYATQRGNNIMAAGNKNADLEVGAADWTGKNTMSGAAYSANTLRDIGNIRGGATADVGAIRAGEQHQHGTTQANLINTIAGMNSDRITDLGNVSTARINALGSLGSAYEQGRAGIQSQGTLAIGNATADGINGVNSATVDGIKEKANAEAAAQAATGQIWNNALNRAANTFTTFYTMNGGKK